MVSILPAGSSLRDDLLAARAQHIFGVDINYIPALHVVDDMLNMLQINFLLGRFKVDRFK